MENKQERPLGNINAGYIARDRQKNSLIKHGDGGISRDGTIVSKALSDCFMDLFRKRYDEDYINYSGAFVNTDILGIDFNEIKEFSIKVMGSFGYSREAYLTHVYESSRTPWREDEPRVRFCENSSLRPLSRIVTDWYTMQNNEDMAMRPEIRGNLVFPGLPFTGWPFINSAGYLTDRLRKLKEELPAFYLQSEWIPKNLKDAKAVLIERGIETSEEEIMKLGIAGQIATSYIIGLAFSQLGGEKELTKEDESVGKWFGVKI
ncbi:MAG: hypothetical protein AABW82_03990 [Nanoarchaeota archaeon]